MYRMRHYHYIFKLRSIISLKRHLGFGMIVACGRVPTIRGLFFGVYLLGMPPCCLKRSLRAQVPDCHILAQDLYYNYYYTKPKYLIIGYMDPLGISFMFVGVAFATVPHSRSRSGLVSSGSRQP